MNDHLVFFDGTCNFCSRSVNFLLEHDKDKKFLFSTLQGETAKQWIPEKFRNNMETSILVENYKSANPKIYYYGKGAFRALWLLGGAWKLLGWPSFFPAFLYDWGYRLIASHRNWFTQSCKIPTAATKERFLP